MLCAEIIGLVQLWPGRGLALGEQGFGFGLSLGLEGWGLGLGTCGLVNISGFYSVSATTACKAKRDIVLQILSVRQSVTLWYFI